MANRIKGNVVIVDSAMGNTAIDLPTKFRVASVNFWALDTTGLLELADTDTTDIVIKVVMSEVPGSSGATKSLDLGSVDFDTLKVPTLTAGTAWLYLE